MGVTRDVVIAGAGVAIGVGIGYKIPRQSSDVLNQSQVAEANLPAPNQGLGSKPPPDIDAIIAAHANDVSVAQTQQIVQTIPTPPTNDVNAPTSIDTTIAVEPAQKIVWDGGMKSLAIFYAWPQGIIPRYLDDKLGEMVPRPEIFGLFYDVFLGAGLEIPIDHPQPLDLKNLPKHGAYPQTKDIVSSLTNTNFWGYVNAGNRGVVVGADDHSPKEFKLRVNTWNDLYGVTRFMLDECSPTYAVNKFRLLDFVSYIRDKGWKILINSDSPEWLISTGVLQDGDSVLVEPFMYSNGRRTDANEFEWTKVNPYLEFIKKTGIGLRVYAVATYDPEKPGSAKEVMEAVIPAAVAQQFYAFCITNPQYSAWGPEDRRCFVPRLSTRENRN